MTRSREHSGRKRSTPSWWWARSRRSRSANWWRKARAIAKRVPALEKVEIEQGAFGGHPPRPADSFDTLAFSVRLVATTKSDTDRIAELVKQLYLIRQNISAAVPGAGLMETPDLDEPTPFLIHPGTRAYVNGEQKTLFDRYSDWIYFGAFIMSGLGSVLAGLFGWLGRPPA